jgi:ubiquinone/menaquinone biosynthesis C-methylase UbiE
MFHRYHFASNFCEGKEVLEVACGAGQGLGYLAGKARRVVGGDYTEKLVQAARDYYKDRVEVHNIDAHQLPFEDKSFDVVILYEAIYYLAQPEKFLQEAHRVLRDGGILLIATVNKDWGEFNPSPLSIRYFSVPELSKLLLDNGFKGEFYGAFSGLPKGLKERTVALIKRTAVTLHLIPKTMKGKEFLKRIFFGKLIPLPPEITDGMAEYMAPVPIPSNVPNTKYKVIYAIARIG